jgi:hypothetical protein
MTPEQHQQLLEALERIETAVRAVEEKLDDVIANDYGYPIKSELENVTGSLKRLVDRG